MHRSSIPLAPWWGTFAVPFEEYRRWRIGPLSLWIRRISAEWRIAHRQEEHDEPSVPLEIAQPLNGTVIPEEVCITRFGVTNQSTTVEVMPALADRAIVSRPEKPFFVPPKETIRIFVSTPVWMSFQLGGFHSPIYEVPILRPSDSWFGSNTLEGELCYATKAYWRTTSEHVELFPHRAVTAVTIVNETDTSLPLERLKIPVTHLSLYATKAGSLWTEDVMLRTSEENGIAAVRLAHQIPDDAPSAELVAKPRHDVGDNLAMRVFSSIFNGI